MKTILSIGEATLDSFVFVSDVNVYCKHGKINCQLCITYADKIVADKLVYSVGGNAANTAVAFSRLGMQSQLYSVRGTDWIGKQISETLEKERIDCRYIQIEEGQTSCATALIYASERTLVIYHVPREYDLPSFEPVDWVYLTSMGKAYLGAYEKALTYIKEHKIKVSFNPGTYQLKAGIQALKPFLKITEALFVNKEEAQMLTELPASATVRHLSEALYEYGPNIVTITDGPKGAYCFNGEQLLHCKIFPSEVIERTGCGDSYAAAFTAALLHGEPLTEAMRWGMANSSSVVTTIGPQEGLLHKSKLAEILNDNHTIQPHQIR